MPAARAPATSSSLSPTWIAARRLAAGDGQRRGEDRRVRLPRPDGGGGDDPVERRARARSARGRRRARSPSWRRRRSASRGRAARPAPVRRLGTARSGSRPSSPRPRPGVRGRRRGSRRPPRGAPPARRRPGPAASSRRRTASRPRRPLRTRPAPEAGDDRAVEQLPRRPQPDHGAERVDQAGAVGGGHEYILTEPDGGDPDQPRYVHRSAGAAPPREARRDRPRRRLDPARHPGGPRLRRRRRPIGSGLALRSARRLRGRLRGPADGLPLPALAGDRDLDRPARARPRPRDALDGGGHRAPDRPLRARAAAALTRRLQLHLLRAPRGRARAQPLRVRALGAAALRRGGEAGPRLPRRRLRLRAAYSRSGATRSARSGCRSRSGR